MADCMLHLILFVLSTTIINAQLSSNTSKPDEVLFIQVSQNGRVNLTPQNLTNVNPVLPTVFLIHGWYTSLSVDMSLLNITTALSDLKTRNVIYVDWSSTARGPYKKVVYRGISKVGTKVGEMIMLLHTQLKLDVKNVQIIGVTLGAHIAGHAGRYVKANHPQGTSLGRITALEASGYLFYRILGVFINPLSLRRTDADIVDVTHTNYNYFGSNENIGTVDFFVNGGATQPFCGSFTAFDFISPSVLNTCSHAFATVLYQLTISNENYKASTNPTKCENTIVYGDQLTKNATGIYFINTENTWPYKTTC